MTLRSSLFMAASVPLALVMATGMLDAQGSAPAAAALTATLSGRASITVDPAKRQVCYDITVSGIDPATMAHIHRGAAGASGPPVVSLSAPKNGAAKGCVAEQDAAVLAQIIANPANFYVNVHTSSYRAGAVRGQLRK